MQNYKQEVQMKNFQPAISPYLYLNPSLPFGMVRGCLDKREKKKIEIFNTHVKIAKEFSQCPKIYEIINVLSSLIYILGRSVFKQAIIIKCTLQRPKFKVNLLSMCQELGTNTLFKF